MVKKPASKPKGDSVANKARISKVDEGHSKKKSSSNDNKPKPEPSSKNSSSPAVIRQRNWMGIGIAILAFAVGVLCPPMLKHFQVSSTGNETTSSDAAGTTTKQRQEQLQHRRTTSKTQKDVVYTASATHSVSLAKAMPQTPQYPCTDDRLAEFVHDEAVAGFHILCLKYVDDDGVTTGGGRSPTLHLDVRVGGTERNQVIHHREMEGAVAWDAFKVILQDSTASLHSSVPPDFQPWALFTPEGERLFDAMSVEDASSGETFVDGLAQDIGMVLLFTGGQFLWPGVRLGFKREIALYSIMPGNPPRTFEKNQTATLETLSLFPLVLAVEGFLSKEECRHIQVLFESMPWDLFHLAHPSLV
jgi:hypothetical protein